MSKNADCSGFQDRLDALSRGELPEPEEAELRHHAESCEDCGVLLRMQEHVAALTPAELEVAVPSGWIDSMWSRVRRGPAPRTAVGTTPSGWMWRVRWLVPAMAAAVIMLIVATGVLFHEVRQLRSREQVLVQHLVEQQERLTHVERRASDDSGIHRTGFTNIETWERVLARREAVRVRDIDVLLAGLPSDATVVDPIVAGILLRRLVVREPSWEEPLGRVNSGDGLQTGEVLELVQALDPKGDTSIPTQHILAFSRSLTDRGLF